MAEEPTSLNGSSNDENAQETEPVAEAEEQSVPSEEGQQQPQQVDFTEDDAAMTGNFDVSGDQQESGNTEDNTNIDAENTGDDTAAAETTNDDDEETTAAAQTTEIEPTGRDYTTSEFYPKLIDFGIATSVAGELIEMFDQDMLKYDELEERTLELVKSIRADQCSFILRRFREANLIGINNIPAYLGSLLKNFKERLRVIGPQAAIAAPIISTPAADKIQALLDRTGYPLEVTIGQRKFGGPPPDWPEDGAVPSNGCEVYIGKIPRDIFEDELIPLFEPLGRLYDFRLMMDPISGYNKGYAFVTYVERECAKAAAVKYEGYEIRKGKRLRVNVSIANTRLFVGNIPKSKGKDDILEELTKVAGVEGIAEVIVYASPDDPERKKNRGFCFLDFRDHKMASQAKRRLTGGRIRPWNSDVVVDWAEPQDEPDEQIMSQVKVVYVRPVKDAVTEDELTEQFKEFGEIERVKKVKDYAFIHFVDRECALKAIEALNGKELSGMRVELSLAKPQGERKKRFDTNTGHTPARGNRGMSMGRGGQYNSGGADYYGRTGGGGYSTRGNNAPRRPPYVSRGGYDYSSAGAQQYYGNYDWSEQYSDPYYSAYDWSGHDYSGMDWETPNYGYSYGYGGTYAPPASGYGPPAPAPPPPMSGGRGGRGGSRGYSNPRGRGSSSASSPRGPRGGSQTSGGRGSYAQSGGGRGGTSSGMRGGYRGSFGTPSSSSGRGGNRGGGGAYPMKRKAQDFGNNSAKRRPGGAGPWGSRGGSSSGAHQQDWASDNFADDTYS